MVATTESVAFVGTEAFPVDVEIDVSTGVPVFRMVGLPAKSVMEAEQRTRAALLSSGQRWPPARITANLAPGALRKEGTHFDLAIALGMLVADGRLPQGSLDGWISVGELGLDGSVRSGRGTLAAAITCRELGRKGLICPAGNAPEAAIIEGIDVVAVSDLRDCIGFLDGTWTPPAVAMVPPPPRTDEEDLSDVRGHEAAKRALEIAAAGGHNLMLTGPPGSGKTMLARRLPGILPDMSLEESLEVTRVYSVAGLLPERAALITTRPFRSPHHHVSTAGLIGGGSGLARPGEVSLAHHGVLFLDEISLFHRDVLDSLRSPLEEGAVRLARSAGVVTYPSSFSLIAASNPCPCGFLYDSRKPCRCSGVQLMAHQARLSGPLVDRIDIQVEVSRLDKKQLMGSEAGERSAAVRERVEKARLVQAERFGSPTKTNAFVSRMELEAALDLDGAAADALGNAIDALLLTGRGMTRTLRVARTIADLQGSSRVTAEHIIDALTLRFLASGEEQAG